MKNAKRRIVLHIGLPKTGTSTIQNVLRENHGFLFEKEQVLYPSLATSLNNQLLIIFRDEPQKQIVNRMAGLTMEEIAERQKEYRVSLDTEVSSLAWDTLLLSAEGLSNLTASEMSKLREWGENYASDWRVLVCVRHPIDYVRSIVQQLMKGGDTLARLYENPPVPNYKVKISNAISVFGEENVHVFDFGAATENPEGIVGEFAAQAGLSESSGTFLSSQAKRVNESLSFEAIRILDSWNHHRPMFSDGVRAPRRSGRELAYLRRIEGRKFDLPLSVKDKVRSRSREDVIWLNKTFGLDLYRDIVEPSSYPEVREEPVEALSDPAIDSIAEIIGDLVTEMVFRNTLNAGKKASAQGDFQRAAEKFKEAIRLDPDATQPVRLLNKLLRQNSR